MWRNNGNVAQKGLREYQRETIAVVVVSGKCILIRILDVVVEGRPSFPRSGPRNSKF